MSTSYDETALGVPLNYIRWKLADTDTANPLHTDEHIAAAIAEEGSTEAALISLADELVVRFGREPDRVTLPNGMTVSYAERIKGWTRLVTRQEAQGAAAAVVEQVAVPTTAAPIQGVW